MSNSLMIIFPYLDRGIWVFDDESVGLNKEPFVAGIPEMIEILVQDIPDASQGFALIFSVHPFPGYQAELLWMREEYEGHWYCWKEREIEGWLCPALFKYFDAAPPKIFCKAERQSVARSGKDVRSLSEAGNEKIYGG